MIKQAWQKSMLDSNYWVNIQSKFTYCSKELMRWDARKIKLTHQELNERLAELEILHHNNNPNITSMRQLEEEITRWLEQEDVK